MPKYTESQLLKAVKYAENNPDIPLTRIATLYEVNLSTLRRRKLGLTLPPSQAHRDEQLLSSGEERAIADHCAKMADHNFPVSHDLLRRLAQDILNSRNHGKSIPESDTPIPRPIGDNWVDRFLKRNPTLKAEYVRYQEKSRLAVSNNVELQLDFLKKLSNLARRLKVQAQDVWNCDEKGITMGRQVMKTKAIVRAGTFRPTAACDGNREFTTVLETINAAGEVILPFIVWTGSIHSESYYQHEGYDGTFAVSKSGYMDNELGMGYMEHHFEPHTRRTDIIDGKEVVRTRLLIVNGHVSHLGYSMLSWAIEKNIHVICLPSKSTHILQPLDVGCFGLLQRTYEENLRDWGFANPLGVFNKVVFLEILHKTRDKVYTPSTIRSAWRASYCWPVDIEFARSKIQGSATTTGSSTSSLVALSTRTSPNDTATLSDRVLNNVRAPIDTKPIPDTPLLLRQLAHNVKISLPDTFIERKSVLDALNMFSDIAGENVMKYRDIEPRAQTISTLRNGKVRIPTGRRRHVPGAARIMSRQMVDAGLKQLADDEQKKLEKEHLLQEKKRYIEERVKAKVAAEEEWRLAKEKFEMEKFIWEANCKAIEEEWWLQRDAARAARIQVPKKPQLPPRPKRPIKSHFIQCGKALESNKAFGDRREGCDDEEVNDEEDFVESMRAREIEAFATTLE